MQCLYRVGVWLYFVVVRGGGDFDVWARELIAWNFHDHLTMHVSRVCVLIHHLRVYICVQISVQQSIDVTGLIPL